MSGRMRARGTVWLAALLLSAAAALLAAGCGGDDRPTVRVLAASSLTTALPEIAQRWEAEATGAPVELRFGGSQALAVQIEEGAPFDLLLSARPEPAARLARAALTGEPEAFASNRLALLVDAGAPWRTVAALAEHDGLRVAVAAADVPVGALTEEALADLPPAVARALRSAIVTRDPNARVVRSRLELGEVDAVFVYETDLAALPDARALPLVGVYQADYVLALAPGASEEARAFAAFLAGPVGQAMLGAHGFGAPAGQVERGER